MAAALAGCHTRPPDTGGGPGEGEYQEVEVLGTRQSSPGGEHEQSYASIVAEGERQDDWRLQGRRGRSSLQRGPVTEEQGQRGRQGYYSCREKGYFARDCGAPRQPKQCYNCKGDHLQRFCLTRREGGQVRQQQAGQSSAGPGGEQGVRPELRMSGGRAEDQRIQRKKLTIGLELGGNKMIPSDEQMGRICRRLGMKQEEVLGIAAKPYGMEV